MQVYVEMTISFRFFEQQDILVRIDPKRDSVSIGFSHVTALVILNMCNIKIFVITIKRYAKN